MSELVTALSDFHFLRPLWLLALLAVPPIYLLTRRFRHHQSGWESVIDTELLEHMLHSDASPQSKMPVRLLCLALILAILSLAGPSWRQLPQPVHRSVDALVVVFDLSLSMQAEDLQPSRLVKARHKLIDILNTREQGLTGLVVYAGAAHKVSPLTDDRNTIIALVPALSPLIMPALGSKPEPAIDLALQLLEDGGVGEGKILLITDGIEDYQSEPIAQKINNSAHSLSILAVGTSDGAPIPIPNQGLFKDQGEIVIARMDSAPLRSLAANTGGRMTSIQLDDSDIKYLLPEQTPLTELQTREVEREFDQWYEEGPWLLLLLAPLAALAFRRGWLLSLGLVFLIMQPSPSYALSWRDLWQTPDQQGAKALEQGNPEQAAQLFESPLWKGSAAYQAGKYEQAIEAFAKLDSADAHFNRGNALAKAGELKQALEAYQEVLDKEPQHQDAAFNKALVEKLLQQEQQQQEQQKQEQQGQEQQQADQNEQQEGQNQQQAGNDSQSSEDNAQAQSDAQEQDRENQNSQQNAGDRNQQQAENAQQQDSGENEEAQQDPQQTAGQQTQTGAEAEEESGEPRQNAMTMEDRLSDEERQELEQWLRRIPDDPAGLLRRKFSYEFRERQRNNTVLPQDKGDKVW